MNQISGFNDKYRWLSNFWPCKVYYEGMWYPSSEHAFQAAKTNDTDERLKISFLKTASQAKSYGRKVTLRPDWDDVKIDEMRKILACKFTQNIGLKERLLNTGDAELVEDNWWGDTFWGVCKGVGENHLGKLLMGLRAMLRDIEPKVTEDFFT